MSAFSLSLSLLLYIITCAHKEAHTPVFSLLSLSLSLANSLWITCVCVSVCVRKKTSAVGWERDRGREREEEEENVSSSSPPTAERNPNSKKKQKYKFRVVSFSVSFLGPFQFISPSRLAIDFNFNHGSPWEREHHSTFCGRRRARPQFLKS